MTEALRIVIAEDNYLVREGTRRLLEEGGVTAAAAVGSAPELLDAVGRLAPTAVLTDIRMPPSNDMDGIHAAHTVRADHPNVGGGSEEPEPVGIPRLTAGPDVDRDAASIGPQAIGVLVHRLEVRAAAVQEDHGAAIPTMIPICDVRAVRRLHPPLGRTSRHRAIFPEICTLEIMTVVDPRSTDQRPCRVPSQAAVAPTPAVPWNVQPTIFGSPFA